MPVAAKLGMKVITVAISVPVGIVTKKGVEKLWLALRPDDPPRKAKQDDVTWADALTWGALSATGLVVADLVTRKGAEEVYRTLIGTEPPASAGKTPGKIKQAEAQEKDEKAAKQAAKNAKKRKKR